LSLRLRLGKGRQVITRRSACQGYAAGKKPIRPRSMLMPNERRRADRCQPGPPSTHRLYNPCTHYPFVPQVQWTNPEGPQLVSAAAKIVGLSGEGNGDAPLVPYHRSFAVASAGVSRSGTLPAGLCKGRSRRRRHMRRRRRIVAILMDAPGTRTNSIWHVSRNS
jgi:hypothetical protein